MKLTAKLPEADANGLTAVEAQMVDRPDRCVTIVAVVDVHKLTTDMDTGDVEPTVRIVSVEALTTDLDAKAARKLLDATHTRRTGRQTLPLDDEAGDDEDIDPETGQIRAS